MQFLLWYTRVFVGLAIIGQTINVINSRDDEVGENIMAFILLIPIVIFLILGV